MDYKCSYHIYMEYALRLKVTSIQFNYLFYLYTYNLLWNYTLSKNNSNIVIYFSSYINYFINIFKSTN